jgi:hypothetical protein
VVELKTNWKETIKNKVRLWIKLILNWRFVVCFGLAWMITNGWAYILLILGLTLNINLMYAIAMTYITFIWLPVTPEKIITVTIALFLVKILFPQHNQELKKQIEEAAGKDIKRKKVINENDFDGK